MDVNATAEAMHVHPNTLRYRLGRVEKLLGRSLRQPATIAELTLALHAPADNRTAAGANRHAAPGEFSPMRRRPSATTM